MRIRTGAAFNPSSMTLFLAWTRSRDAERAAIARGAKLFGSKPIAITGVGGLNDALGLPTIKGTCTTCHDAPNIGNHSVALPLDIGVTDASRRTPDMPLYTLQNLQTGEIRRTTDPGRALLTGLWKDIAKFKGPILRGLAARPPYFHNGLAADLGKVVEFYDTRFSIGFTDKEKADLVAFLERPVVMACGRTTPPTTRTRTTVTGASSAISHLVRIDSAPPSDQSSRSML